MFEMEECSLEFTDGALREIAHLARSRETGARGLRSILEQVMFELMFELPELERGQKFVITEEIVRGDRKSIHRGDSAAA
jgi:ATP-dependent Clp protease ATP-binding subunit ClpX